MTEPALRIRYAPDLLEAVVEHLFRRREAEDRPAYERYRRAADRIYALHEQPDARRAAFHALHTRLFEESGCGEPVAVAAAGFAGRIEEVLVTRAWSRSEEGAELSDDGRMLGLRLLPAWFGSLPDLRRFLRHECGHVADMLDETFGYGSRLAGVSGGMPRLHGDRFGFLWDCSVDGRTERAGGTPLRTREGLEEEGVRLFPTFPREVVAAVVRRLWEGERPPYALLVRLAVDPAVVAAWAGASLTLEGRVTGPLPGAPCPLCGFPTHAWAPAIDDTVAGLIEADFPTWRRNEGACARCVEGYALRIASA